MTGFIVNIIKRFKKMMNEPPYTMDCVEISEDGFQPAVKGILLGKTVFYRRFKKHYWKDVKEIDAWYSGMAFGIDFVLHDDKRVSIDDYDMNWDRLVDELPERFDGFNMNNLKEYISSCKPAPCWHSDMSIGNLKIDRKRDAVVWEEDGSIFCIFEDDKEHCKNPRDCVERDEEGFRPGAKYVVFGKTVFSRRFKKYYWKDIKEIYAFDGGDIVFYTFDGEYTSILDSDLNWDRLLDELPERFEGFNVNNFELSEYTTERLPCWSSEKPVGNLKIDKERRAFVWEKDGSILSKISDDEYLGG